MQNLKSKIASKNPKLFKQRMRKAKRWARIIGQNPNVVMVAMTGSMATGNAIENSDIDFFVQVLPNKIWSARFFIMLKLKLAGELPDRYNRAGKFCLNWWADFNVVKKRQVKHMVLFSKAIGSGTVQSIFLENICQWVQTWRLKLEQKQGKSLIKISDHELCLRHRE